MFATALLKTTTETCSSQLREEPELKLEVIIANVAKAAEISRETRVDLVVEMITHFASVVVSESA